MPSLVTLYLFHASDAACVQLTPDVSADISAAESQISSPSSGRLVPSAGAANTPAWGRHSACRLLENRSDTHRCERAFGPFPLAFPRHHSLPERRIVPL